MGWTFRLFNYYKVTPLEDFEKLSLSNRQLEIKTVTKSKNLQVGDEIEAKIKDINGNKVTYQLLNIFPKTEKEPKYYTSLKVGQTVKVEILKMENGVIKKVKYIEPK